MPNSLPISPEDFGSEVRFTDTGMVSVHDAIRYATGLKNPKSAWERLGKTHPDVVAKCDHVSFKDRLGRSNKATPVADLQVFLEILVILPGRLAAKVREESVRTLIRAMRGDVTLVEEIIERIHNPQDLRRIELRAKTKQSNKYLNGKIHQHGGVRNQKIAGRSRNTYAQVANMNNVSIKGMTAKEIQLSAGVKHTRDAFENPELERMAFQEQLQGKALDKFKVRGHFQIVQTVQGVIQDIDQVVNKWA